VTSREDALAVVADAASADEHGHRLLVHCPLQGGLVGVVHHGGFAIHGEAGARKLHGLCRSVSRGDLATTEREGKKGAATGQRDNPTNAISGAGKG
jgi:hypothetical protein